MNYQKIVIPDSALVKVTKMNSITEVQFLEKVNRDSVIKKLSKTEYVDLRTGEIKEFELNEDGDRSDNNNSLQRTFKKLRSLINNNFVGSTKEVMITLTYKENMTDFKRLSRDFAAFRHKLDRLLGEWEYIRVAEPQERGAWHLHVLAKVNSGRFYIANSDLAKMWGHGFTFIKQLKGIDNVGAYLSAYLANMPAKDVDITKIPDSEKSKKVIKGARLHLYEKGMHLYTKSKGIQYPDFEYVPYSQIKKTNLGKLVFEKSIVVTDDEGNNINSVRTFEYNSKRK